MNEPRTRLALLDVLDERRRQHAQWGEQDLPHELRGADVIAVRRMLRLARRRQDEGRAAWAWVLLEEACEACLASEEERRGELVQAAAVACQWLEALEPGAAREAADRAAMDACYRGLLDARTAPLPSDEEMARLFGVSAPPKQAAPQEPRCCDGGPRGPSCGACEVRELAPPEPREWQPSPTAPIAGCDCTECTLKRERWTPEQMAAAEAFSRRLVKSPRKLHDMERKASHGSLCMRCGSVLFEGFCRCGTGKENAWRTR